MGLVTDEGGTAEPVISALSGRPMDPLSIDRPMKDWLTDPSYSMEAFRQAGGKDPIVELMRENVEIHDKRYHALLDVLIEAHNKTTGANLVNDYQRD